MENTAHLLQEASLIYGRANSTSTDASTDTRPPVYKAIGISLAVASGLFIGVSFILKKIGLLKANEKYSEAAGEGYGYLKNAFWWTGMTLMIIGEICNFVAYAFVDAILVTPLGALSVVITTIGSAIFLKERLSMVGKIGCFLCIIGSVVIVMNAPAESSAATIQEMQHFVIAPGFLVYAGIIIVGCAFIALWVGPRYGKKSMLVYLSICSLIGGLSVVATQGLGAAIVAQIGGIKQYNQWFLYVLFVFVITTLMTEIIFLNVSLPVDWPKVDTHTLQKALNLFNAALVTPTYYVCFTSSTIITSAILFRGFKGTPTSIVTVVLGFFVICAGVVLLQLSKSAKDVPDTAVFTGDLDQMRTIAEQEQPESEPKADAIRGAAAIVRRISTARQKMEMEEVRRLHEERQQDLAPIGEDEIIEWDGLRRRRTTIGSRSAAGTPRPKTEHYPLGMTHFPSQEELRDHDDEENRPSTGGLGSSFLGSIRSRTSRARSLVSHHQGRSHLAGTPEHRSPMHPVALTEISMPYKSDEFAESPYYLQHDGPSNEHVYGLPSGLREDTTYKGAQAGSQHVQFSEDIADRPHTGHSYRSSVGPTPPPHARRQFSFQNVFRKHAPDLAEDPLPPRSPVRSGNGPRTRSHSATKGATEEERLGLVKGDTNVPQLLPQYSEEEEDEEDWQLEGKSPMVSAGPERMSAGRLARLEESPGRDSAEMLRRPTVGDRQSYEESRHRWSQARDKGDGRSGGGGGGGGGAFI